MRFFMVLSISPTYVGSITVMKCDLKAIFSLAVVAELLVFSIFSESLFTYERHHMFHVELHSCHCSQRVYIEMPGYGHSSLELVIFLARSIARKK